MQYWEKVIQIVALMPEHEKQDLHYKLLMMTGNSEKFMSPRVKKLYEIYKWLDDEEKSIFKATLYCYECEHDKNVSSNWSKKVSE